jgi:hypothetical protein
MVVDEGALKSIEGLYYLTEPDYDTPSEGRGFYVGAEGSLSGKKDLPRRDR